MDRVKYFYPMDSALNFDRIRPVLELLMKKGEPQLTVGEVARQAGLSEDQLNSLFSVWAGLPAEKFLSNVSDKAFIKDITHPPNISDHLPAYSHYPGNLRVRIETIDSGDLKSTAAGMTVHYGIHATPFGRCLVALCPKGICALEFVDNDTGRVIEGLRQQWQAADVRHAPGVTEEQAYEVFYSGNKPIRALLIGTPFQTRVWQALLKIPYGKITTYSEIAEFLGKPGASRAVGSAVGKNRLAWLIPCHRVFPKSGGVGGYKWGRARKLAMIGFEKTKRFEKVNP